MDHLLLAASFNHVCQGRVRCAILLPSPTRSLGCSTTRSPAAKPRDGLGRAVVAVSNLDRDALSSVSVVGNALRLRMVRALGRPARENWSELWDDLEPLLAASAKPERPSRPRIVRSISSEEDMERPSISTFLSAVLEADGTVGGVLCIVSETTELVRAVAALRESEARLRELNETLEQRILDTLGNSNRRRPHSIRRRRWRRSDS